jgi:hypothetical protein
MAVRPQQGWLVGAPVPPRRAHCRLSTANAETLPLTRAILKWSELPNL